VTRISPTIGLRYILLKKEENRIVVAERMKRMAVRGFIGADPIAKLFNVVLSICHPSKTINGTIKTIHPSILEPPLRNSILVFTQNLF